MVVLLQDWASILHLIGVAPRYTCGLVLITIWLYEIRYQQKGNEFCVRRRGVVAVTGLGRWHEGRGFDPGLGGRMLTVAGCLCTHFKNTRWSKFLEASTTKSLIFISCFRDNRIPSRIIINKSCVRLKLHDAERRVFRIYGPNLTLGITFSENFVYVLAPSFQGIRL